MNQLAQEFRDLRLKMDLGLKQAANKLFKKTIEKDEMRKGQV